MLEQGRDNGWVKLHRKALESRVWRNADLWHLWSYCLLRANHQPGWVTVRAGRGTTEVYLEAGQFIFGSRTAAKALRAKWRTTLDRLQKLSNMQNLALETAHQYTIVTICNWTTYQSDQIGDRTETRTLSAHHPHKTRRVKKVEEDITTTSSLPSEEPPRDVVHQVFNHWNSYQGRSVEKPGDDGRCIKVIWKRHRLKPDGAVPRDKADAIRRALDDYSVDDICAAITNYATVLLGPRYRWTYAWTLAEFLTRGEERHKQAPRKWYRFLPDNFDPDQHLTDAAQKRRANPTPGPAAYEIAKQQIQAERAKHNADVQTA